MTKVSIIRCKDYEQENIDKAVQESLNLIGGLNRIVKPKDRVLLKINLLSGSDPSKAIITHPAIIKSVARLVKEAGGIPIIADSPGSFSKKVKNSALIESGIKKVADDMGVEALQFETIRNAFVKVDVPDGVCLKTLYAARIVLEADVIINLPKLKTHIETLYTGAVKNMFGAVPPKTRKIAHNFGTYERFSNAIVDIYSVVKPHLSIMDAVIGMEGEGPGNGNPKFVGLILASCDSVALDAVASKIIKYEPMDIYTTKFATERGLGNGDLSKIETLGEEINKVIIDFKKPRLMVTNVPPLLMGMYNVIKTVEPRLIKDKCKKCGICAESCPPGAINLNPYPVIDRNLCIECFCCSELCPESAIRARKHWIVRLLGEIKKFK